MPGQTLILTDLSPGMLDQARATIQPAAPDFATRIVFQQEDGTTLAGIANDSIDLVVSLFGVFLIPDQHATLQAIQRVLRPDDGGVFANASWMFHVSDDLSRQGFGVSLQDAFNLPNDVIHPPDNDKTKKQGTHDIQQWATAKGVQALLADTCAFQRHNDVRFGSALHTTVWEWEDLWQMLLQNPMSALRTASPDDVAKAKTALIAFLTLDSGATSVEEPLMLSTASLLTVVRGFGKEKKDDKA